MNDLQDFVSFAKRNTKKIARNNKAVIYTRVSDFKQKDNTSLESQKLLCEEFALKNNYEVCKYFGGTHESAKTDERKAYKEMLTYVKQKKITNIIVYSLDRYSRTGGLAIATVEALKKKGIRVLSLTQNIDSDTPTGTFMQNFHLLYSRYDNDIRSENTKKGMRHRIMTGYWMGTAPIGFKNSRNDQNIPIIVQDDKAPFIKKAFHWKANEGLTNVEIVERLKLSGLTVYKQLLSNIFRNPVYCGLITNSLIEGKVVKGNHKPIVSQALFLKVNGINRKKSAHNVKNENLPLKTFMTCASCKSPLTGFIVKAKGIYYYKCKTIGCSCNRNAEVLHTYFKELLTRYQIDKRFLKPLKIQLKYTLEYSNKSNKEQVPLLKGKLKEVSEKIEKIQERYVIGEIEADLYKKFKDKFSQEKEEIEAEIKKSGSWSSNLEKYIESALKLLSNLHKIWELSDYTAKQKFQKLLFPNGIEYHRQNDRVQTFQTNAILELIHKISINCTHKKSGQLLSNQQLSAVVTSKGFEPPTLRAEI
ncbi:recombinase family protein [uncultured Dokdonia sp.]|uniref:recombinase family protein n=1 Tax=uncultured Dokdonia sp. TaxID=575653 RepID=UPI0026140266|nr:recombinase family protein [uncultured Dokdonia sp.]